jgi:TorA maturation chaperone TorD
MSAVAAPVRLQRALPPEEAARGDFYALLARLLYSGADAALLQSLAHAEPIPSTPDGALAKAWNELSLASSVMDPEAAGYEYDELFVGVGKAPLSIYAGFYTGAMAIDHPRVRLQAELAALGLGRREAANEPEDHFAALLDVMRVLVAGGAGRDPASVAEQKRFFAAYLKDAAPKFFNAVIQSGKANYYRKVAALGLAFMAIENESYELDS